MVTLMLIRDIGDSFSVGDKVEILVNNVAGYFRQAPTTPKSHQNNDLTANNINVTI